MADQKFDDATKKEIDLFLQREQAQATMHQRIHTFTTMCWDKCMTGTPSTKFSRSEESCLTNCVDRFLDASMFLVRRIQEQQQGRT